MELYLIKQAVYVPETDDVVFVPFRVFANGPENPPSDLAVDSRELAEKAVALLEEVTGESFTFEAI